MKTFKDKLYILHYIINKRFPKACYFTVKSLERMAHLFGMRRRQKRIFIYGEPRSGTSFITALLLRMGHYPGPYVWLLNANQHNPDGYFECVPFQDVLDDYIEQQNLNFEHKLPNAPIQLPYDIEIKLKNIVMDGNIGLLKYNKFSLCADAIAKIFPEAIWIHVTRESEAAYQSNKKFMGNRDRTNFFKAYNQRRNLWQQSRVSKRAFEVNFSTLKEKKDVQILVDNLCVNLDMALDSKTMKHCVALFRPKSKRTTM